MKRASKFRPYNLAHEFRAPAGVASAGICDESGNLAGSSCPKVRTEWFINGTEPTSTCESHGVPAEIGAAVAGGGDSIP